MSDSGNLPSVSLLWKKVSVGSGFRQMSHGTQHFENPDNLEWSIIRHTSLFAEILHDDGIVRCPTFQKTVTVLINPQNRQVFWSPFCVRQSSVTVLLKRLLLSISDTALWKSFDKTLDFFFGRKKDSFGPDSPNNKNTLNNLPYPRVPHDSSGRSWCGKRVD